MAYRLLTSIRDQPRRGIMFTIMELARHFLIIAIISAVLLTISASFFLRFILPAGRIRKELQASIKRLGQIKDASSDAAPDIDEITREVFARGSLKNSWQEYRETLHRQRIPHPSGESGPVRLRATALAEIFFSEQALVDTPLKTQFYKHLPGILTGLGIIGTFSGLINGLIRFEVSGDAEKVRASLNGLIQSVGYSFVVSAAAITLSMVFIWVEKSLVTSCYRQVEDLCRLIDSLFDPGASEEYLARLVESAETSTEQVQEIRDSLTGDLRQVLTSFLNQQMETMAAVNRQLLTAMARDLGESIREPMERIAQAVDRKGGSPADPAPGDFSGALTSFCARMEEIFDSRFQELGQILRDTGSTMETAALHMARCMDGMENAGKGTEEAVAERMNRVIGSLDERQKIIDRSVGEFMAQTSLAAGSQKEATMNIQTLLADVSRRMAGMMERIEAGSKDSADAFEARNSRISEQIMSVMNEMNSQLKSLAVQMRQAGDASRESTETLALMARESSELFTSGRDALRESFHDFVQASRSVSGTMQAVLKAADAIRCASSNLEEATGGVKEMLDGHRQTNTVFAAMVSDLRSTIENARHEASMTSEIVGRIQQAARQLGIAQVKAEEYLHGLTDVLAQAHSEFAGNIEQTLRKSNAQFHEELSRAVSLVSGAIQDFGDVLDAVSIKERKQCWV